MQLMTLCCICRGMAGLPWWEDETQASLQMTISELALRHADSPLLPWYIQPAAVLCVYAGTQGEGTLPAGCSTAATFQLLVRAWGEADIGTPATNTWHEEGGRSHAEGAAQLAQHMKALKLLCVETLGQALDEGLLLRAYAVLMDGAVTSTGARLLRGYRPAMSPLPQGTATWQLILCQQRSHSALTSWRLPCKQLSQPAVPCLVLRWQHLCSTGLCTPSTHL